MRKVAPLLFFLTQKAFEYLHEIDLHCGGGIGVAEERLVHLQTRDRYYVNSVIEEALTPSQLEGAVVTRSEARELIRRKRPPTSDHERMELNNYRTMRLLFELKKEPLSTEVILRIHREVTAGTLDDPNQEGRFRYPEEDVRIKAEDQPEGKAYGKSCGDLGEIHLYASSRDRLIDRVFGIVTIRFPHLLRGSALSR